MLVDLGLDHRFVQDIAQYPARLKVLEYFLARASQQDKIVVLHAAAAESEAFQLVEDYAVRRPVIHWYWGPHDIMEQLLALGAFFTIGVEVLYSDHIQAIANAVPSDRLLTETDNPGGYQWLSRRQGGPGVIREVVGMIAGVRQAAEADIVRTIESKALRLMGHDPQLAGFLSSNNSTVR